MKIEETRLREKKEDYLSMIEEAEFELDYIMDINDYLDARDEINKMKYELSKL